MKVCRSSICCLKPTLYLSPECLNLGEIVIISRVVSRHIARHAVLGFKEQRVVNWTVKAVWEIVWAAIYIQQTTKYIGHIDRLQVTSGQVAKRYQSLFSSRNPSSINMDTFLTES